MTRNPITRDIGRLIVIEDNKVVGVISHNDILKLFLPDRDPSRETTTDQPGPLSSMDPD
jgi:CBS domain-containing protein